MMTCSRTYQNIKKTDIKPKSIGKCRNMIFNFFKSNDFFLKKMCSNVLFSYTFFTFVKNFRAKKKTCHDMCI
jgi:hypothetical protein